MRNEGAATGLGRWCTLEVMYSTAMAPSKQRSTISIVFTSTVRVLFTTLLFSAAGMGAGLFCGIVGTVIYGIIRGAQVDMSNAYKHVAIPAAVVIGTAALVGALVLEVRAHRQRTSQ
jgi:hypothetical protein